MCWCSQLLHYTLSPFWLILAYFGQNMLRHFHSGETLGTCKDWPAPPVAHLNPKKWTHFFKPLCKIWRVQKKECKKTSLRGWASIPAWNPFSTENLFSETTFKDKLTIWLQILCLSLPSAKKMPELRNMGWSRTPNMQKFTNRMQVNPFANSILSTLVA